MKLTTAKRRPWVLVTEPIRFRTAVVCANDDRSFLSTALQRFVPPKIEFKLNLDFIYCEILDINEEGKLPCVEVENERECFELRLRCRMGIVAFWLECVGARWDWWRGRKHLVEANDAIFIKHFCSSSSFDEDTNFYSVVN